MTMVVFIYKYNNGATWVRDREEWSVERPIPNVGDEVPLVPSDLVSDNLPGVWAVIKPAFTCAVGVIIDIQMPDSVKGREAEERWLRHRNFLPTRDHVDLARAYGIVTGPDDGC